MFPSCITHVECTAFLLIVIQEKSLLSPMKELSRSTLLLLRSSQASVRQFLFQRTQVAGLLAQGCHVAPPRLTLAELLIQGAHLYQIGAGELVTFTIAHRN